MDKQILDNNLLIATSHKRDGDINARLLDKVTYHNNRDNLFEKLHLDPDQHIGMGLVHGSQVRVVDKTTFKKYQVKRIPETDGLITNLSYVTLLLSTADCIPLALYDKKTKAFGLCHVGWRGAMEKIYLHAILKMSAEFGTKTKDLAVWLGPAIQSCCYIRDKPPTQRSLPEWQPYITSKADNWHIDYVTFVYDSLLDIGISKSNITNSGECTCHSKADWYSYARHQQSGETDGRFATIVRLLE